MLEKITEAEINERSMARVSTTPGRPTAFGQSNMDPEALKLRFDRLGRFLAGKINQILGSIEDGSIAGYIYVDHNGDRYSLEQFVKNLLNGDVGDIKIKTSDGIVYLTEVAMKAEELYNGQSSGDTAKQLYIVEGVTLKSFYEEFKKLEENGVGGGNGKSAYEYAVEGGYQGSEEDFSKKLAAEYPTKLSEFENDEKFISADSAPVQRVNGQTGFVNLNANDVGARPHYWMPSYSDVNADKAGTAQSLVSSHNTGAEAHNDIRLELQRLAGIITDVLDSDDSTLDEMHEVVAYIKSNKTLIDAITASKVNVSDIINNLTSSVTNKPLSAAQGVVLKALIDAITVPTKVSQLDNDKGYLTSYTESDPTVPAWAKAAKKPSYMAEEVGARPDTWMPTAEEVKARPNTWMPTYSDVGAEKSGTADTKVSEHNISEASHNDIRLLIQGISDRLNAIANSDDTALDDFKEVVAYIKSNKALIDSITTNKINYTDIINDLVTNVTSKPLSAAQGVALKALIDAITVPTKVSELENDKGYLTSYTESDPTVPSWAKASSKPSYTAAEVGALPSTTKIPTVPTKLSEFENDEEFISADGAPVKSVNNKTGDVKLSAEDVGARPNTWMPSYSDVNADKAGTAQSLVSGHNTNTDAHNDIRLLIQGISDRLNAFANSDDESLDQAKEFVAYMQANRGLIEAVTTQKVNYTDIINDLVTNVTNKPLSAAQGVALKALIDAITVPTKVSQLDNDKGYLTSYTESDPTVPAWAKAASKPSYTAAEVGAVSLGAYLTLTAVDKDGVTHSYTIYGKEDGNAPT